MSTDIEKSYPLHFYVWNNDHSKLREFLAKDKSGIEILDPRGRTPLMLAIILGHIESVRVLLCYNANVFCVNQNHWTATQEAISTGDPEMVKLLLMHRDEQRIREQSSLMTRMLSKLKDSPDFYVELKWEFSSWLPLLSRMCPSDICRVWKSGANVRIDTTLVGFSGSTDWVRGNLSYLFRLSDDGATLDEVNHQEACVYRHKVDLTSECNPASPGDGISSPTDDFVAHKLTQPVFATYVDTDKIEFERSKSGIWGWRSDKHETIGHYNCQVYSASNVQIVTLRRTEHLDGNTSSSTGGGSSDSSGNPLTNLLKQAEVKCNNTTKVTTEECYNPNQITAEEYFNGKVSLHQRSIGRPKSMTTKVKTFKAHLSICNDYALSLQDQVLPIIDLMAEFNPHFHKLKDFITMQLPAGFPMKIEIPLYHILTARVTFENLYAANQPAECVNVLRDVSGKPDVTPTDVSSSQHHPEHQADDKQTSSTSGGREKIHCVVNESIFNIPAHYRIIVENSPGHGGGLDEEEQMVQMAVQASLAEYGGGRQLSKRSYSLKQRSVEETSGDFGDLDDAELQRAIAASLTVNYGSSGNPESTEETIAPEIPVNDDEELVRVLELSKIEK